ncbi:hypothetical protein MNBD_GAMMA09-991 [hydrothermal vent metagenome]|uniref:Uncharacterized protein n=1 Tax=hydrothermal vent metagenome TaxID=652676 RepID=A0A3B0Y7V6_9ZZZZ
MHIQKSTVIKSRSHALRGNAYHEAQLRVQRNNMNMHSLAEPGNPIC